MSNTQNIYDTIVIGAGIAGCSVAYELKKMGQNVLVIDRLGVASGGSGAAGAFVSPKVGKGSNLQKLTNQAFSYSYKFYLNNVPQYFRQTGVLRIPKELEDSKKFVEYEKFNTNEYVWYDKDILEELAIDSKYNSFYFSNAGDVDAKLVCEFLMNDIELKICDIETLKKEDSFWFIGEYKSINLVLATGYESKLVDLRYMGVKGTWGNRADFQTSLDLPISIHKNISIGANVDGVIKLGATHEKTIKEPIECSKSSAMELLEKASYIVNTSDFKLKEIYCGMRAGSKDYFPLVGKVIDVDYMLNNYPNLLRGAKPDIKHFENLFICNGLGGRGFVFGPYVGKLLADYIVKNKEIDSKISPDRLFYKWCRKLGV